MQLIPENTLEQTMREQAEPYLDALCTKGKVNDELYYEYFRLPAPKGTVVISHGFTEAAVKYHESICYLLRDGWDCAILDHRGHGFSARVGKEKNVVHIDRFDQYVEDLHAFVHGVVLPEAGDKPLRLFGHSMGGCIAARYLEEYPEDFGKAVLNAPMLGLQTGSLPSWLCVLLCDLFILFGKGEQKLFFHSDFNPDPVFEEDCATSRARFDFYQSIRRGEPALQTAAASYGWTREAILAGKKAVKNAEKIRVPVLLLQAENDTLVAPAAQAQFIARVPNGTLRRIPNSKHEIYRSENAVLETYWPAVLEFLA